MPNSVIAIVPVYRPDVRILNKCLGCVLPQVRRVIIATEGLSIFPSDTTQDSRISISHTLREGIGFGANVNQGAYKADVSAYWLLILNDDVFLNSDAVERMLEAATPYTDIVVHLLRYQDGRIFSTVCARNQGDLDFHHVDNLKMESSIKNVCEIENACGASLLVRLSAFIRVGGYDEEFFCYSEDNDLSMRIRQEGGKIMYTPHAKGWHVGHQSTRLLGNLDKLIAPSAARFKSKWGQYLEVNRFTVPGTFDYEKVPNPEYVSAQ